MKLFYNNSKYAIILMVVLALVLQITGPIISEYVYANENVQEETEEKQEIKVLVEEDNDGSGDNKEDE